MFVFKSHEDMIKEVAYHIEQQIKRQDIAIAGEDSNKTHAALYARGARAAYYDVLNILVSFTIEQQEV